MCCAYKGSTQQNHTCQQKGKGNGCGALKEDLYIGHVQLFARKIDFLSVAVDGFVDGDVVALAAQIIEQYFIGLHSAVSAHSGICTQIVSFIIMPVQWAAEEKGNQQRRKSRGD